MEQADSQREDTRQSAAYRDLYETYYARVLAYCARRVGHQDAADLAAEVFAICWRRYRDVPTGDKTLPWLYGVAYRVVLRHYRTRERWGRLRAKLDTLPAESVQEPAAVVVRHRDYELVLEAAAYLRPKDQEVLRLALWEELSHNQIAEVLGSTAAAVRQRFYRAKRALAREFEKLGGTIPAVAQEGGES